MPGTSPIRLGDANTAALVPQTNSQITTDDFGIQRGSIRYSLGDQSISQSVRIAQGTSYIGMLTQFAGFYVQSSGDITGGEGQTAVLDVKYAKIDPLFINTPEIGMESEVIQMQVGTPPPQLSILASLYTIPVVVPNPTATFSFSASSRFNMLGNYSQNPVLYPGGPSFDPFGVPVLEPYVYKVNQFATTHASVQSIETLGGVLLAIALNGSCTLTAFSAPARLAADIASDVNPTGALSITFVPDPQGWLCVQDNSHSICNGRIFEIRQKWVRRYIFSSMSGGVFWSGVCL